MGDRGTAGAALRAALEGRGCALRADEARALADALLDLIASGMVVTHEPAAVHQDAESRPHLQGSAGDLWSGAPTAPAYNMGQSNCIGDEEA